MSVHLTIDEAGRIVIPKFLRDDLKLEPGDSLDLEAAGDEITLRPVRENGPLGKKEGVWVFRSGSPLQASATDEMLQRIRTERDATNFSSAE